MTTAPFRYLWMALGVIALAATVLALGAFRSWAPMAELGEGGLERWIVYPIVLWLVAFGNYLLATTNPTDARNPPARKIVTEPVSLDLPGRLHA